MKTMELRSGRCQIDSVETRLHYLHAIYKHPRAKMDKTNQTKAFFFYLPLAKKRRNPESHKVVSHNATHCVDACGETSFA